MSTLVVNGNNISGTDAAVAALFLAISSIVQAGDTHTVVFEGDMGRACILVNPATQAQLTLNDVGDSVVRDAYVPNVEDVIRHYTPAESVPAQD